MKRFITVACLVMAISLLSSVIWQKDASAAVMPSFESLGQIQVGYNSPSRMALDDQGNIYVANSRGTGQRVVQFSQYKKKVATYDAAPVVAGFGVSPDGSRLYAANKTQVAIVDAASDTVVGYLHAAGVEADTFGHIADLALDAQGYVYVGDSSEGKVKVYDPAGVFHSEFGAPGLTPGLFGSIGCLAVNSGRGEVYVGDSAFAPDGTAAGTTRIQVFDLLGNFLRQIEGARDFGGTAKPLYNFSGLSADAAGRLYVFDLITGRLAIVGLAATPTGSDTYLGDAPIPRGHAAGAIAEPRDAIFDLMTNRLFVLCGKGAAEIYGVDSYSDPVEVVNTAPGLPVPVAPMAEVAVAAPIIEFSAAQDNEDNVVSYDVRVVGEAGEVFAASVTDGTSIQIAAALVENGAYSWQVQAVDAFGLVSGWTGPVGFYVNSIQEAPATPVLAAPMAGEVVAGADALLWTAVADPDPNDTVGYRVEVAVDPAFAVSVVSESLLSTASILGELSQYADLQVGQDYFWRVVAIDNHGLSAASDAGTFQYDTSLFRVSANMPGALVYLGGNHAYRGSFLGEAPVEVRDFVGGPVSVVVERAGFEPYVAQVQVGEGEKVEIYAELAAGFQPDGFRARPLTADKAKVVVSGGAAPFAVDFDSDGIIDLLVGTNEGRVLFYAGVAAADGEPTFSAAGELALPQLVAGASPFVADWNNDGRKDLLLGGSDGTVALLINVGSEQAPVFTSSELLMVAGSTLDVGESAVPVVGDYDGDQLKDLVVGAADGRVLLFPNAGSDDAPQLSAGQVLTTVGGPVAPFFSDWNSDGNTDLLVASGAQTEVFARSELGVLEKIETVAIDARLDKKQGSKGKKRSTVESAPVDLGAGIRVFALDLDGQKGKDLLVGNESGELLFAASSGLVLLPAFQEALLLKIDEINTLVADDGQGGAELLASLGNCVETCDFAQAGDLMDEMLVAYSDDGEILHNLDELNSAIEQMIK